MEQEPTTEDMGAAGAIYDNAEAKAAQVHVPMPSKEETLAMYDNTENLKGTPQPPGGQSAFNMGKLIMYSHISIYQSRPCLPMCIHVCAD